MMKAKNLAQEIVELESRRNKILDTDFIDELLERKTEKVK